MKEIIAGLVVLILLVAVANPFEIWMPDMTSMLLLLGLALLMAAFVAFVLREHGADEREEYHKLLADRYAFLAGAAVLILAIIRQEVLHSLDRWLILALGVMVLAKIMGLIYGRQKY